MTVISLWYEVKPLEAKLEEKDHEERHAKDAEIDSVAEMFDAKWMGSGCGYGQRDIEFEVPKEKVDAMLLALLTLSFNVYPSRYPDDDDDDLAEFQKLSRAN
jgi:hypothetical protein